MHSVEFVDPGGLLGPPVVCVMTLHKLAAGSGYTYLTKQVAAHDATESRQAGLAPTTRRRARRPVVGWVPGWSGSTWPRATW